MRSQETSIGTSPSKHHSHNKLSLPELQQYQTGTTDKRSAEPKITNKQTSSIHAPNDTIM
eukprot:758896-Hanusia_phi.AAC.2